jgi:hypothetical protein
MLPRTTQQSHSAALSRESQIEPWLALANTLLAGARARSEMTQLDGSTEPPIHAPAPRLAAEGLDVRKKPPLSKEEECFLECTLGLRHEVKGVVAVR